MSEIKSFKVKTDRKVRLWQSQDPNNGICIKCIFKEVHE